MRPLAIAVAVLLVVAACSGASSPASSAGTGQATAASTPAAATPAAATPMTPAASEPAPSSPEASTTAGGGGGGSGGVCDLVTKAELEQALGLKPVVTAVVAGPPDTCDIQVNGAPTAAIVYMKTGAKMVFDTLASGSDAQAVAGIGDRAFYSDQTQYLVVLKGDAMISIAVVDTTLSSDAQRAAQKKIGAFAAGRM